MTEVARFHILAHIFISLIGGMLLLAIWYNIRKRFRAILEEDDSQKRVDKGLLHLSSAVFVWVLSGIWAYIGGSLGWETTSGYQIGINLLSTLNNLFFLLALFYFYHGPAFLYNNSQNILRIIFIILAVMVISIIVLLVFGGNDEIGGIKWGTFPDFLLSASLAYLLALSLYRTFHQGGLQLVAIISVLALVLMFGSQLPEVFPKMQTGIGNEVAKIVAKTSLIAVFLVLATSWVIRLANMPRPQEMTIQFMDWSLVKLTIPSKDISKQHIDFGSKTTQYKNLLKLAIRRKYGEGLDQSIEVGAAGEIKSQTYLSRIIDNINEILSLEAEQKLDRRDLFTFIGEGRYRLRMIPEHITIDQRLLEEFVQGAEEAYRQFMK